MSTCYSKNRITGLLVNVVKGIENDAVKYCLQYVTESMTNIKAIAQLATTPEVQLTTTLTHITVLTDNYQCSQTLHND